MKGPFEIKAADTIGQNTDGLVEMTTDERDLRERLYRREFTSYDGLSKAVLALSDDLCGTYGRKELVEITLPNLRELYTTNFKKMGLRALEIIKTGSELGAKDIGPYFSAVLNDDITEKGEMETLDDVGKVIRKTIRERQQEHKELFGKPYSILGAISYGSWVKGNQQPESDVDLLYLVRWPSQGFLTDPERAAYLEGFNPKRDFDYCKDFEETLKKRLGRDVDNYNGQATLDERERIGRLLFHPDENMEGQFKVISPYKRVHRAIDEIAAEYKPSSALD